MFLRRLGTLCKVRRETILTRTVRCGIEADHFLGPKRFLAPDEGGGHTLQSAPRLALKFKWADQVRRRAMDASARRISPRGRFTA